MDKRFPWLALKHIPKYNSLGLNGIEYWTLFITECLQTYNLKKKSKFNPIYQFSCFFYWIAIYKNAYKGLHKSMENHWTFFIKVNFFIIFNFSIRWNTIFSTMNINFFNDSGNAIFNFFFQNKSTVPFWKKGNIIFLVKGIFTEYT